MKHQNYILPFFNIGAGIYLVYGRILHLARQLSLCQAPEDEDTEGASNGQLAPEMVADILEELQANTQQLIDLLQSMPTPTIRERLDFICTLDFKCVNLMCLLEPSKRALMNDHTDSNHPLNEHCREYAPASREPSFVSDE